MSEKLSSEQRVTIETKLDELITVASEMYHVSSHSNKFILIHLEKELQTLLKEIAQALK